MHIPSDFMVACLPEMEGTLIGDKAVSVVFDNSKIKRFVPDYVATTRFAQGIRQSLAWFDADPGPEADRFRGQCHLGQADRGLRKGTAGSRGQSVRFPEAAARLDVTASVCASTGARSLPDCPYTSRAGTRVFTISRHPPKPPNLRHFRAFPFREARAKKLRKRGLACARKMIYLGRHKIWAPGAEEDMRFLVRFRRGGGTRARVNNLTSLASEYLFSPWHPASLNQVVPKI